MNLTNAPERGKLYALYTDKEQYESYEKDELPEETILTKNLLELHLFDEQKEYRYVRTARGEVEVCVDDENLRYADHEETNGHDGIYIEKIFTLEKDEELPEGRKCVEVVNYLSYDEDDLMMIKNYRLKEVR